MKKLILTLIVSWIGLNISAQSFGTYLKHNDDDYPSLNTVELPNHQYLVGTMLKDTRFYATILYKLSASGIKQDSLRLPFAIQNLLYKDNKIYFFATANPKVTKDTIILGVINPVLMDTIMTSRYYTSMKGIYSSRLKYFKSCDCFTSIGVGINLNNLQYGFIVQFDSLLNTKHTKYYKPWFNYNVYRFINVIENPAKNGYWVSASGPLDSTIGWPGYNTSVVIPMDSNLNRDSTKTYPIESNKKYATSPGYVGLDSEPIGVVKLTDSTYLFAGRVEDELKINGQIDISLDIGYIIMDTNLTYVKHEFYGRLDTLDNGSFNMVDRNDKYVYIFHTSAIMEMYANYIGLTKVDLAGNHLWTKYYTSGTNIHGTTIMATSDGGALMTSQSRDAYKSNGPDIDLFILKVDSNGNGPGLLTSLSKLKIVPKSNYLVYPNPVKNELHLLKVNTFGNYTFTLYDAFGREVKSTYWTEDEQILSTSGLAAGVYIYRIKDNEGRKASGKIVKQ